MYFAPFYNLLQNTGDTGQNRKHNVFSKFIQQFLVGSCCVHNTILGAMGYNVKKSHKALGMYRSSQTYDTRQLGDGGGRVGAHMGSNSLCYLCFGSVFQNNIPE